MRTFGKALGTISAALALVAFPAAASAEYLIPPGNSAVNQYTESVPTGGGDRNADRGKRKPPPPDRALGRANARRLQSKGADGRATAELAAATAPQAGAPAVDGDTGPDGGDRTGEQEGQGGGSGTGGDSGGSGDAGASGELRGLESSGGASGFGETASQATGLGSGALLPLLIIATIAWAILYVARQRRSAAP